MADRYWILGTGSWSSTNTVNWSTSSGGAGGASVPTASDNVFFDANSNVLATAFTVTMANTPRVCNDFTASGLDGTMTLAGTSIGLTVSGSLTFQATNFTRTYTGTTIFNATTTGKTITTNGVAFGANIVFDGVGGGWTLGSAINIGSGNNILLVSNGTFDTSSSGNYSVTGGSFSSSNTNSRTINLNASTVTLASTGTVWSMATSTNATLNAGTSTINCTSGSVFTFAGGGLTFYNVAITNTDISNPVMTGANTFNNLSITGQTSIGVGTLSINANQTINGTFTVSAGTAAAYRILIFSNTFGTSRTLTCAAVSLTDTDFRDITIAGAASPASGTRLGDCKGNSGITFDAAKTVFYRQTGSANWGATGSGSWSATSGGALDATQFPLAQDTAVFPAATYPASGSTTTINAAYSIGTIDMSLRTSNTMTLATGSTSPAIFGNWINGTGITVSGTGTLGFAGRTTQQITSSTKTFTQNIDILSPSGSVTLQDAMSLSNLRAMALYFGTLDLNGQTLTVGTSFTTGTGTKNLTFNGGTIFCPAATTTAFNNAAPTGFTTTAGTGTGTISMTAATAKTFVGGGSTFNCTLNQGGAGALTITGSNTFSNITNTYKSTGATSILFTAATTSTFADWNASGETTRLLTIGSVTAASHTLSKASGTVSSDYLSVSRSTATGGAAWYAGANSTDGGNNTGWSFAAAPAASSGYPYGSGHYGIGPYNIGNLVISGNVSTGAVGTLLADRSIQEDGTIATGNVGTVGLSISVEITGNAATCAVGSVIPTYIQAITGNASTLSVGSVTQSAAIDLVGNASIAAVGTVNITSTKAITGNSATGAVGTVGLTSTKAIAGNASTAAVGTIGFAISIAITDNAATGAVNSLLVSPIITGNAATGAVGTVGAEVISFQAITGVNGTGSVGTASNVISIGIIGVESICAVGIMIGFGWGSIPNTSETWTPEADTSESWTPVANSTESWTSISDTSESWTDLSDNSITWQEAA